jgi:hypothetical protein
VEGLAQLRCRDCGRTASVSGELPAEYFACFVAVVQRDGWVVAPGHRCDLLCGACLASYEQDGSESKDDGEKIRS